MTNSNFWSNLHELFLWINQQYTHYIKRLGLSVFGWIRIGEWFVMQLSCWETRNDLSAQRCVKPLRFHGVAGDRLALIRHKGWSLVCLFSAPCKCWTAELQSFTNKIFVEILTSIKTKNTLKCYIVFELIV